MTSIQVWDMIVSLSATDEVIYDMLEILYRIYQVATPEEAEKNLQNDIDHGLYSSTSQAQNFELLMDCMIVDSREQFKSIIRDTYGAKIKFAYSKKLNPGDLYCIIIGEHCYNTERYFDKITYTCSHCGCQVTTYSHKPIRYSNYEIQNDLFGIEDYKELMFCSQNCKRSHTEKLIHELNPQDITDNCFISPNSFESNVVGYIYKITKKSTGQFYIGQTRYVPVFRWGQHLKTERFPLEDIQDYQFEVIAVVHPGENILEVEKYYIQTYYTQCPEKSLNIACTKNLSV